MTRTRQQRTGIVYSAIVREPVTPATESHTHIQFRDVLTFGLAVMVFALILIVK